MLISFIPTACSRRSDNGVWREVRAQPLPVFPVHIFLHRPPNLNACNRLFFFLRSYCIILRLSNAVGVFVPCDYYLWRPNASVNSSCARPPSPPADPRADSQALAFFLPWMANSRGWGLLSCQIPRGGDEKRGQMPRPPSTLQHFSLIAQSNNAVLSILTCDFLFQFLSSFVIALGF